MLRKKKQARLFSETKPRLDFFSTRTGKKTQTGYSQKNMRLLICGRMFFLFLHF
ncbi:hypothetical protein AB434_4086 [Heyndrickxia coagulans]|nr:hypothetical protein AB434_4086 [Heyndrickxia coagulans]